MLRNFRLIYRRLIDNLRLRICRFTKSCVLLALLNFSLIQIPTYISLFKY